MGRPAKNSTSEPETQDLETPIIEPVKIDPFIKAILGKKTFAGKIGFGEFIPVREKISTGSIALDLKIGGGFPTDRVVEYYGPTASCKTSFALIAMRNYVRRFGYDRVPFIVDVEKSITPNFVAGFDLDPNKILVVQPDTAEAGLDMLSDLVRSGKCGLGMYDSVDAMETEKESNRSLTEQGMAELPKLMSRVMRKLCKETIDNNCGVIFINQIRACGFSGYGPKEATSGGNALPFYAHLRIRWKGGPSKTTTGAWTMTPVVKKNKLAPLIPAESTFEFFPGRDVDVFSDYLEASKQIGTVLQSGKSYTIVDVAGNEIFKSGTGKEAVKEWMFSDIKNQNLWGDAIREKWAEVSGSMVVETSGEEQDSTTSDD